MNQFADRSPSANHQPQADRVLIRGVTYECRLWPGDPKLPALVATHGLGDATDSFSALGNDSRLRNTLVAFSLRGSCGTSPLPAGETYSHATFTEDLANITQHFGFKHVVLIGPSFGGPPAIRFARFHPDSVSGLVLVDSLPFIKPLAVAAAKSKLSSTWPDMHSARSELQTTLGISEEQATSLLPSRLVREFGAWKYALDQTILRQLNLEFFSNVADDARQLTCPVLCLRSSHQSIIDDTTWGNLAAIIPNATGAIIPQSRHTVMLSAPEAFNARILDFLHTFGSAGDTWQEF